MSRRTVIDIGLCAVALAALYAARGCYIAYLIEGRYAASSLLIDAPVLAILVVLLRFLDLGVKTGINRSLRISTASSRRRRVVADASRFVVVLVLVLPPLVTLSMVCPQRIHCAVSPEDVGFAFEEVALNSGGLRLAGWHIPAPNGERPVVLITHGLGANKQNFLPAARIVHGLGYPVLIIDFRAHGDSEGRIATFGYLETDDIKAAHDWIRETYPGRPVYALAYSMGGAAVIRMAAFSDGFEKIVLDSTFARAENVGRQSVLWWSGPLSKPLWQMVRFWGWALTGVDAQNHEPEQLIAQLAPRPILLIHSKADRVIPHTEASRLWEATHRVADFWLLDAAEGYDHCQTMAHLQYAHRLRRFFEN